MISAKRWPILIAAVIAIAGLVYLFIPSKPQSTPPQAFPIANIVDTIRELQAHEDAMAEKHWGPELLAQKHGELIDGLWDALNAATNKFMILKQLSIPKLLWSERAAARELPHAIRLLEPSDKSITLNNADFRQLLEAKEAEGWQLTQCEFRHIAFSPNSTPRESTFYFSAHLDNPRAQERAILEGDFRVKWTSASPPAIEELDATRIQVRTRAGPVPFKLELDHEFILPLGSYYIDPLIVLDIDGDNRSEIILAARNEVFRRNTNAHWTASQLCEDPPRGSTAAIMADFTRDGFLDFLEARSDGLFLHPGASSGKFPGPARKVWAAQPPLKNPQVITCGDIDADGDLDLYIAQYRVPFENGNMPVPYFNALDGLPGFLLLNDGQANFTDATTDRGLAAKRYRRTYSASFIDLDRDQDLDLLLVSDFAGLDAFQNDGRGVFTLATTNWFQETRALGMSHCFQDFNADGRLDILMIGMNSPTVDRLESMGLNRPYDLPDAGMRRAITYGNRLYFGNTDGTFRETDISRQIARTGWSWGCAAEDFDRDGFPDLYIANGHATRKSVRDYETEFWLHDIYVRQNERNASAVESFFREGIRQSALLGWSYGGYEKNRFFLSQNGTNFIEVAHLLGLALEADSRNVVAKDLNGDNTPDLIVTTFEGHPTARQTLKVYRNNLSPRASGVPLPSIKVTGASYRSQW